jgi:hypothetical protein
MPAAPTLHDQAMDSENGQSAEHLNHHKLVENFNFLAPLGINTDYECEVNHQTSPREELYNMAQKLDAETKEKQRIKNDLDRLELEFSDSYKPRIKKLEEENQDMKNEIFYLKRVLKEFHDGGVGNNFNSNNNSQVDQLRSENLKLKTDIETLQITNTNQTKQVNLQILRIHFD